MNLIDSFGTIATILFISGTVFQAYKSYKDGHSESMSYGLLWSWFLGLFLMLTYVIFKIGFDPILIVNYLGQLTMVMIIKRYKYFPRKVSK